MIRLNQSGTSRVLLAGMLAGMLGACVSTSTRPSMGLPTGSPTGSPPPTGSPSGSPAGSPAGKSSVPEEPGGTAGGQPGSPAPVRGAETPGTRETAGTESGKSTPRANGSGGRSDEEILAEALEEFERRNAGDGAGTASTPSGSAEAGVPAANGQNADSRLDEKFAEFDRTMLKERAALKEQDDVAGNRGFSDRGTFGEGDSEGTEDGDEGGEGELKTAMAGSTAERGNSGSLPGESDQSVSDVPADVASMQDDDIIARQLREAAMKERDPELRAKLWDEYRKYKKGG